MLKLLKNRYFIFALVCVLGFAVLVCQLAYLTVEMGETYYALSMERKSVELPLRGSRGNILDRNGVPLAMDKQIFVVELDRQRMSTKEDKLNQMLCRVVEIIEDNNDTNCLMDNIPIKIKEDGRAYYLWEDKEPDAQNKAFKKWKEEAGIEEDLSASEMLEHLRKRFKIDEDVSDDLARNIISIRLDIFMNRYRPNSIRIAMDVSQKTVAQLEAYASELPGLQVVVETGRYYPMGDVAAHIIGYVGRISAEDIDEYKENGIDLNNKGYDLAIDRIGKRGIEKYAEEWLTANTRDKHGKLWAEVNSTGKIVRVMDEEPPQDGNVVVTTLDSRLQKAVEDILAEEIQKMVEGLPPYEGDRQAPYAERGAAVVMDLHTGELLTLASYPSFDLNLFIPKISNEEYKNILEDKGKPLTAVAFQERFAPGSVFKMMVGLAGLTEGKVGLKEQIYDAYQYDKYSKGKGPRCWAHPGIHGNEDFVDALKHSCDYYFYELADRLGIDKIGEWGERFGLAGHTGLEVGDVESSIGGRDRKPYDEYYNIIYSIDDLMRRAGCFEGVDKDTQKEHVKRIAELPYSTSTLEIMEFIRDQLGYFNEDGDREFKRNQNNKLARLAESIKYDVLIPRKEWKALETVITGIGQGYVQVTSLAMARYVAALVNGGKVLETHVMKSVVSPEGDILHENSPVIANQLEIPEEYMEAVRLGMHKVVYDTSAAGGGRGTAVSYFADLDPGITLGGKTGTAQTGGGELKNTAWFVSFTPYEDPEVVVVVMIPNGRAAGNAALVTRRILEEYYHIKDAQSCFDTIEQVNQLKP